jgi:hypothetical protein
LENNLLAQDQIKNLFFEVVVAEVTKNIVASVPFLGLPVINWFFVAAVNYLAKKMWKEMEIVGAFMKIDFRERANLTRYNNAEYNLRKVLNMTVSQSRKEEAINEYTNSLRDLIRINTK